MEERYLEITKKFILESPSPDELWDLKTLQAQITKPKHRRFFRIWEEMACVPLEYAPGKTLHQKHMFLIQQYKKRLPEALEALCKEGAVKRVYEKFNRRSAREKYILHYDLKIYKDSCLKVVDALDAKKKAESLAEETERKARQEEHYAHRAQVEKALQEMAQELTNLRQLQESLQTTRETLESMIAYVARTQGEIEKVVAPIAQIFSRYEDLQKRTEQYLERDLAAKGEKPPRKKYTRRKTLQQLAEEVKTQVEKEGLMPTPVVVDEEESIIDLHKPSHRVMAQMLPAERACKLVEDQYWRMRNSQHSVDVPIYRLRRCVNLDKETFEKTLNMLEYLGKAILKTDKPTYLDPTLSEDCYYHPERKIVYYYIAWVKNT